MKMIIGLARSLFGKKGTELNQSKLVGLYLSQANGKENLASHFHSTRQRHNGRHTHNRERA